MPSHAATPAITAQEHRVCKQSLESPLPTDVPAPRARGSPGAAIRRGRGAPERLTARICSKQHQFRPQAQFPGMGGCVRMRGKRISQQCPRASAPGHVQGAGPGRRSAWGAAACAGGRALVGLLQGRRRRALHRCSHGGFVPEAPLHSSEPPFQRSVAQRAAARDQNASFIREAPDRQWLSFRLH